MENEKYFSILFSREKMLKFAANKITDNSKMRFMPEDLLQKSLQAVFWLLPYL